MDLEEYPFNRWPPYVTAGRCFSLNVWFISTVYEYKIIVRRSFIYFEFVQNSEFIKDCLSAPEIHSLNPDSFDQNKCVFLPKVPSIITGNVADPDLASGIRCFFVPGIRDEHPGSFFRELINSFQDYR